MPRYKCKSIAALEIALGGLPAKMRVEADVETGVSAKTVGELRKVTTWSESLVITTPQERHPESAVKISKASVGGRNTKIHALADVKGRLIAILLTAGEAHDCPVAERLVRRVTPSKRMLGDKAYDSAELREDLHERGTKPVIPNRCNRKQPFSFNKRI